MKSKEIKDDDRPVDAGCLEAACTWEIKVCMAGGSSVGNIDIGTWIY